MASGYANGVKKTVLKTNVFIAAQLLQRERVKFLVSFHVSISHCHFASQGRVMCVKVDYSRKTLNSKFWYVIKKITICSSRIMYTMLNSTSIFDAMSKTT